MSFQKQTKHNGILIYETASLGKTVMSQFIFDGRDFGETILKNIHHKMLRYLFRVSFRKQT